MDEIGKIPTRQELKILPADTPNGQSVGFTIKETVGVGVINTYPFLPWYKKVFTKTFWNRRFYRFRKNKEVQYPDMIG